MSIIKSFSVYGLFGKKDVHIPFDKNIKILVGENGLGKTQILNLFYYTLTINFFRLNEFNFEKLVLTFSDKEAIEITKKEIDNSIEKLYGNRKVKEVIDKIGFSEFEMLRSKFSGQNNTYNRERLEDSLESRYRKMGLPFHIILHAIEEFEMSKGKEVNIPFEAKKMKINAALKGIDIMYFPTYRRVEEDLHNLGNVGYDEDKLELNQENNLIQFGMNDVQKRFNKVQKTIDELLKKGLSDFTKDILKMIINSANLKIDDSIFDRISEDDLELIFARAGSGLDIELKKSVKDAVKNKQFSNSVSGFLLQKLIELYEKQKELDNSVKLFRDICNRYLIEKEVFYDESAIKIYIKSEDATQIALNKLSSGEKQIISIFSKIYLSETEKRFMVFFDEPELSLSMLWQKQLLPDIINSKKCDFLLAVTHSPFIFENELDKYAVGLNEYIKTAKNITA